MQTQAITHFNIPCIELKHANATAIVALHGAHVLSWIPANGRERLFLSERAQFAEGAAIRGGIPVIFPQFGERGALRKHGFARNVAWQFAGVEDDAAVFALSCTGLDPQWPYACIARLHVQLTATQLNLTLEIENTGDTPFSFTAALHTYLRVQHIAQTYVEGLQGCDYEDSANGGTLHREGNYEVAFTGETDRIYNDIIAPLTLVDGQQTLAIEQESFADAVVWNPGAQLCARIADLAPDAWQHFVCVEAGQVLQPEALLPGQRWRGVQRLG